MAAQSLVLCRDPEVLRTLCPLLFDMDMSVEICLGSTGANRILRRHKFDAVIVECDREGKGFDVLQQIRADSPNQKTIAVGIVDDYEQMKEAFATGANFVLSKPVSAQDAGRILRCTRGVITRMVRRFLRVAVHRLAHVDIEGMMDPAFVLDLSEGGMALQSLSPLRTGQVLDVSFLLPGTSTSISGKGVVAWSDPTGKTGIEFDGVNEEQRAALKSWVIERMHKSPSDAPDALTSGPAPIRVLSQWMGPMARLIDGAFVTSAALMFCLVSLMITRGQSGAHFPIWFAFASALAVGSVLYTVLFLLMDVRFPGTRAVQSILAAAGGHRSAESV
jgi:CheY-like chemotaxis protein